MELPWKSYDVYQNIRLKDKDLKLMKPTYGFRNNSIHIKEGVTLQVTLGEGKHTTTVLTDIIMFDELTTYNAIFGRPIMKATNMVNATV